MPIRPVRNKVGSGAGTAAGYNVPRSGDATADEVVRGSDSRLSDTRAPAAHTHPATQISDSTTTGRSVLTAANAAAGRTALGLGSLAVLSTVDNGNWSGTALAVANGGTGSTSAAAALTALGLPGVSSDAATGALVPPRGTTAQRPGSPTLAELRGNSTIGIAETYQYSAWAAVATNRPLLRRTDLATPASAVTFTGITGWTTWEIEINAVTCSVAGANIWLQFSTDLGSSWVATNYDYLHVSHNSGGSSSGVTTAATAILLTGALTSATPAQARIRLSGMGTATKKYAMVDYGVHHSTNGLQRGLIEGTWTAATTAVDALKIFPTSGTLGNGSVCIYGIA